MNSKSESRYEHFPFPSLGLSYCWVALTRAEVDLFGLLGYDCRRLLSGPNFEPCSQRATRASHLPNLANSYASTYRSVIEPFNSSLLHGVVLKCTQYCSAVAVDRRFCIILKGQKEDIRLGQVLRPGIWAFGHLAHGSLICCFITRYM